MKKAVFIILGVLVVVVLGVLALIYIPSPKFEPVAYEPITPDYWPTEEFLMQQIPAASQGNQRFMSHL